MGDMWHYGGVIWVKWGLCGSLRSSQHKHRIERDSSGAGLFGLLGLLGLFGLLSLLRLLGLLGLLGLLAL
jgi:hypothetical protein